MKKKDTCALVSQLAIWDGNQSLFTISKCLRSIFVSNKSQKHDVELTCLSSTFPAKKKKVSAKGVDPEVVEAAAASVDKKTIGSRGHIHSERAYLISAARRVTRIAKAYLTKITELESCPQKGAAPVQYPYILLLLDNRYPSCEVCDYVFKTAIDELEQLINQRIQNLSDKKIHLIIVQKNLTDKDITEVYCSKALQ